MAESPRVRRYRVYRQHGICVRGDGPAVPGKSMCAAHLASERTRDEKRRAELRAPWSQR